MGNKIRKGVQKTGMELIREKLQEMVAVDTWSAALQMKKENTVVLF